jgi:hypothetical protein
MFSVLQVESVYPAVGGAIVLIQMQAIETKNNLQEGRI